MAGVILSITVLVTGTIVPYATAGIPKISFTHFDRNGMQVEAGDCGFEVDRITYLIRGKTIVKLADGSNIGTEFKAPGGTDKVGIIYEDEDITDGIVKIQFTRGTTILGIINIGLGGATSVDINAKKISFATCGGDVPKGITSATVFLGF